MHACRPLFLLFAALLPACAGAATVTEMKPAEVAAFVARHGTVVLQVTSPDRGCGFCVGADKAFDRVAAGSAHGELAFGRVQHAPWQAFPREIRALDVRAVPMQLVYRDGKQMGTIGGKPGDPATFLLNVTRIAAGPAKAADTPAGEAPAHRH